MTTADSKCQVLNISNVNHKGEVVLNDERLLELIQGYPFIFNPRSSSTFGDVDYEKYAWGKITSRFQSNYEVKGIKAEFTVEQLQERWRVLQPIIKSLSKVSDISSVPSSLRQVVLKMSVHLEDQVTESYKKPLTNAQKVILENIDMVKRLPLNYRKQLEVEMMDLLLSAELNSKGTVKLGTAEKQFIDMECEDFMKAINFKEIPLPSPPILPNIIPSRENPSNNRVANQEERTSIDANKEAPQNAAGPAEKAAVTADDHIEIDSVSSKSPPTVPPTLDQSMLEPLPPKRWIPLAEARFYIRKCRVKVKRTNTEDYVPLAILKKSKIKREMQRF